MPLLLALICAAPAVAQYEDAGQLEVMGLDSTRVPGAAYAGNEACRACHETAYQTWLGTAHSRSWVFLGEPMAMEVAKRHMPGMQAPPEMGMMMVVPRMAGCLACHATAADVEPAYRAPAFRLEEGVQCEGCHGPGSMHIKPGLVVAGQALQASRMQMPDEEACLECHKERASHEPLQRPAFDYARATARTAHPTSRAERWDLLTEQPGAYLSISLRTILGRWFGS